MTNSVADIPPKAESIKIPAGDVSYKAYSEKDVDIAGTLPLLKKPQEQTSSLDAKATFTEFFKGGKETLNEQVDKVKTWASENPNLALGGGAIASLTTVLATFGFIIPMLRARAANRRAERTKHRNRHERRAMEESLHPQLNDDELLDLLSEMFEQVEDLE